MASDNATAYEKLEEEAAKIEIRWLQDHTARSLTVNIKTQELNDSFDAIGQKLKLQDGASAAFQRWDADGDGYINLQELKTVMVEIGIPEGDVSKIFLLCDKNRDGMLDYEEFLSWIFAASPEQQQPRRLKLEAVPSPSGSKPKLETSLAASRLEYSSILCISCKTSTGEEALSFDVSTDSTVFQLEKRIKSSLAWGCLVLVDAEGKVPTKERLSKYKVLTAKEVATPSYALKGIDTEKCRRCESKDLRSDRFTDWGSSNDEGVRGGREFSLCQACGLLLFRSWQQTGNREI
jgi:ribosomal protein L40E